MPSDRMFLDSVNSAELTTLARSARPRVARWVGIRGGGSRKTLECYVCGRTITTYSAEWRMPKHAMKAVTEHRDAHDMVMTGTVVGVAALQLLALYTPE